MRFEKDIWDFRVVDKGEEEEIVGYWRIVLTGILVQVLQSKSYTFS